MYICNNIYIFKYKYTQIQITAFIYRITIIPHENVAFSEN